VGGDAWAALAVELAQREGATGDVHAARDLLAQADALGGVLVGGTATLVARHLGVAHDLLGDEDAAVATLQRAIEVARGLRAMPELARAQADLATIHLRRGETRDGLRLGEEAVAAFRRLGLELDAARAEHLGAAPEPMLEPIAPDAGAILLFTDVVDSTRLTEELGAGPYRARARVAERAITGAIVNNGGSVVAGISLGDGFIGLFPTVAQALDAARRCVTDVSSAELHLHVAVHQGELIVDGDRIYGGAVNMAARVCAMSAPDEILVSAAIHRVAGDRDDVRFVDRGEHEFKGIATPQQVYALVATDDRGQVVA
jgi:class 3 adenylate cyclase